MQQDIEQLAHTLADIHGVARANPYTCPIATTSSRASSRASSTTTQVYLESHVDSAVRGHGSPRVEDFLRYPQHAPVETPINTHLQSAAQSIPHDCDTEKWHAWFAPPLQPFSPDVPDVPLGVDEDLESQSSHEINEGRKPLYPIKCVEACYETSDIGFVTDQPAHLESLTMIMNTLDLITTTTEHFIPSCLQLAHTYEEMAKVRGKDAIKRYLHLDDKYPDYPYAMQQEMIVLYENDPELFQSYVTRSGELGTSPDTTDINVKQMMPPLFNHMYFYYIFIPSVSNHKSRKDQGGSKRRVEAVTNTTVALSQRLEDKEKQSTIDNPEFKKLIQKIKRILILELKYVMIHDTDAIKRLRDSQTVKLRITMFFEDLYLFELPTMLSRWEDTREKIRGVIRNSIGCEKDVDTGGFKICSRDAWWCLLIMYNYSLERMQTNEWDLTFSDTDPNNMCRAAMFIDNSTRTSAAAKSKEKPRPMTTASFHQLQADYQKKDLEFHNYLASQNPDVIRAHCREKARDEYRKRKQDKRKRENNMTPGK